MRERWASGRDHVHTVAEDKDLQGTIVVAPEFRDLQRCIRLQGGGQGFLNLSNLVGYTVYPGVPEIPSDSWMAVSSRLAPAYDQANEYV